MKSGTIGIPVGEDSSIDTDIFTVEREGENLKRSVKAKSPVTTPSGHQMIEGSIAIEQKVEYEESEIDSNGNVQSETRYRKAAESAHFVQVPNQFVILESGAPSIMFDILGRVTDCAYESAEVDIDGFILDQEEPSLWMLGFYEHGTQAENGTLYGSDIADDPTVSDILQDSACNQVGIEHFYSDDAVKARASESGYLEVYSPDYEIEEFTDYLIEVLAPHLDRPTV